MQLSAVKTLLGHVYPYGKRFGKEVKGNGREGGKRGWNKRGKRRGEIKQSENGEEWEEAGEAEKWYICAVRIIHSGRDVPVKHNLSSICSM